MPLIKPLPACSCLLQSPKSCHRDFVCIVPKNWLHIPVGFIIHALYCDALQASLDEPTSCLVMHRTEPSSLQSLSLQLADKLYNLVENNERILDQKPFFTRGMQVRGDPGNSLFVLQRDLWLDFVLQCNIPPS